MASMSHRTGMTPAWTDTYAYDLIVLDIVLPGIDGLTLCRRLRADGVSAPILTLTARDAVDDRAVAAERRSAGRADSFQATTLASKRDPENVGSFLARPAVIWAPCGVDSRRPGKFRPRDGLPIVAVLDAGHPDDHCPRGGAERLRRVLDLVLDALVDHSVASEQERVTDGLSTHGLLDLDHRRSEDPSRRARGTSGFGVPAASVGASFRSSARIGAACSW